MAIHIVILPRWKKVLVHAWSVRFNAAAVVLSGAEVALAIFSNDPPIPRGTFALLAFFVTVAAGVARFVAQKPLSGDST